MKARKEQLHSRILSVDPGQKRIGLAISDPTRTIASPLEVFDHVSREHDAEKIATIVKQNNVGYILIGVALDIDNSPTHSSKLGLRLGDVLKSYIDVPIEFWDEASTTNRAIQSRIAMGIPKKKRIGHHDSIAATVLLQEYLDTKKLYKD